MRSSFRLLLLMLLLLSFSKAESQIVIGGNVYGGGNAGDTDGSSSVTVYAGDVNAVFGGARKADVKGNAFVHIDGEHASDYIVINKVYGGNDISGTINGSNAKVPKELTEVIKDGMTDAQKQGKNAVDNTWNAFLRISTKLDANGKETADAQKIYIGQLFGGGNGDYDYTSDGSPYKGLASPVLGKAYLEILGGSIVYAYGGGNAATVSENTVICVDNPSKVVNSIKDKDGHELLTTDRFQKQMGINTGFSYPSSDAFQIGRFFGGNNKADMAIRPTWNLKSGLIRNLYSGGNQGAMTHPQGIFLPVRSDGMKIDNVFGGCRMADVNPDKNPIPEETIEGTLMPAGYAARVLIEGGDINNVYGGNDVSGNIYGGNAVGIHSNIKGDVYGGGNGSYPYTDNAALKGHDIYGDLYYGDFMTEKGYTSSVDALKAFRPNAESVTIRVIGTEQKKTIVGGAIYCGGNSATLHSESADAHVGAELKIGSYVIADKVFLGNNGANMVKSSKADDILQLLASTDKTGNGSKFNSIDLTQEDQFNKYMDGVTMDVMPRVVFDDVGVYEPYSTYFGSFYCGGNVGSVRYNGANTINFKDKVVVYNKVVGGSNEANVYKSNYNAQYLGGLLGDPDANGNKLILNFEGLKIQPMRWYVQRDANYDIIKDAEGNPIYILDQYGNRQLEWNTVKYDPATESFKPVAPVLSGGEGEKASAEDLTRRLFGGNIYGGCYSNGHVEGNVIINLNASIHERDRLFDKTDEGDILYENIEQGKYKISERHTGVILSEQGMDVLGAALNVFGGGYGGDSEIWGSATINLNKGYTFQIFGGGEAGAIGKAKDHTPDPNDPTKHNLEYEPNEAYSTYINLNGAANLPGVARGAAGDSDDMADCEFIYGGAFEGLIAGSTHINLNNGRIFNSFAGSCNADILGHTETYVGQNGFPWIRDHIYGGNDLGGKIYGAAKFHSRIRDEVKSMVDGNYGVASYMEYTQGRVRSILGGCFGNYDYSEDAYKTRVATKPYLHNSFVNFRPNSNANNVVEKVFGAGEGYAGDREGDKGQDHSYVLIDIPDGVENFANTEIFGAGAYNGLGMRYTAAETFADNFDLNEASAVIDLLRGKVGAAYGGSYEQGITRRTLVNVPKGSTIKIGSIFGGAYGFDAYLPCDVYEANVNWLTQSEDAYLISNNTDLTKGFIYGGNNNARRTLYSKVNISSPVRQKHYKYGMTTGTVYGAGCGPLTWNEYTEVNLNDGAKVYEVYGGAEAGSVMSAESAQKYIALHPNDLSDEAWKTAWSLGGDYDAGTFANGYANNTYTANAYTNLNNPLVRVAEMDDRSNKTYRYNTNVIIHKGAYVGNYAYGGGLGKEGQAFVGSGDVYGTTYIALLGGTVNKDIYAAGTSGAVYNLFGADNLTASANAFIAGGSCRNVYGGGWKGDLGRHTGTETNPNSTEGDILGESHVVIGIRPDQTNKPDNYGFYNGIPAIQRNAYGGGEGGAVFGDAHLTINNGYIGYEYKDGKYVEKVDDETYYIEGAYAGEGRLNDCGNVFGGGYDVRSSVDNTYVTVWNGTIRNSVHGGGEIATIGRGATKESGTANATRTLQGIYKAGKTNVEIYNGHILRNVFGGGKGYNLWGYGQQGTLYTDGYVFGKTEVHVHGGEIGTSEGLASGYGNVFGAGDVGYVYSAGFFSEKTMAKEGTGSPDHHYYYGSDGNLTEDCKVVVSPYLQVKPGHTVTYSGKTYGAYEYVPTDYLNTLPKKNANGQWPAAWDALDVGTDSNERGVTIRNAVFGGGNVSSNSDNTYANATTVYGNTTATLYDVYHRDFITVGTEHTGGLYGGGNLSVVDGYRELNITNYGTDYYGLTSRITLDEYRNLSNRERAYFQLEYVCTKEGGVTIGGEAFEYGQRLSEEKYLKMIEAYPGSEQYWEPFGFCSIYAGRLLNTIQRADLCGVFGSRMVLQGAKDRVADVAENIDYTINRVGELSLNQRRSLIPEDKNTDEELHGNYFGIYSLVNYMGNLTSDVHFSDNYVKGDGTEDKNQSFFKYKGDNYTKNNRNNGKSFNQVALASGVFLELTTENSTKEHKEYGYVTGVVELDLINVKQDQVGGGFVYAKNEHRVPIVYPNMKNVILSSYNKQENDEAVTYKRLRYSADQAGDWSSAGSYILGTGKAYEVVPYQTSGNFIHPSKRIIDDCYPVNNAYIIGSANYSEAHYWYVKGEVYIYDQKVSAYTGSATAYSKAVNLPLTITAASHGKLQLLNVKPNLYAYYTDNDGSTVKIGTNGKDGKPIENVMVNNESDSYQLNDVITWWDWNNLSYREKQYFVEMTYVNCVTVTVDGTEYAPGTYVMDDKDFNTFKATTHTIVKTDGEKVTDVTEVFRPSNDIGHDTGYVLTFDMNSPAVWDDYYTSTTGSEKITKAAYEKKLADAGNDPVKIQAVLDAWREGPTFTPATSGVYGQRQYEVGDIITAETYENNKQGSGQQATVEKAYVAIAQATYTYGGITKTLNPGTAIPESEYNSLSADLKASFGSAWLCTSTVKFTNESYMINGELKTQAEIDQMKADYPALVTDLDNSLTPAYICSKAGAYGGQQFENGTNYSAIKTWCTLPGDDRQHFDYNYDAFDLLASPEFLKVNNDNAPTTEEAYGQPYSDLVNVEYQAVFHATSGKPSITYAGGTLNDGDAISNEVFESQIRNDQRHYTHVSVKAGGEEVYFANKNFIYGGVPYGKGQIVDADVYNANPSSVDKVAFKGSQSGATILYYCYEDYEDANGNIVEKGEEISEIDYAGLQNDQKYFIIQGKEPTETTTLYVSRESDIYNLTKEKVYTVVYQYTYYEDEDDGSVKLTNELHVINVHLQLESGVPQIGTLNPPATVLPGNTVGMKAPEVTPGLYEVLTNGWELFTNSDDADHHRNGVPFSNNSTPVYWYQNGKNYISFYSKTYLGKTYSNPVPLSVANYHDIDRVMADKEHHMYVDMTTVDRPSKIYINDGECTSDPNKSKLDLLKDLFDLSLQTSVATDGATKDHALLDDHVKAGQNLEFLLNGDASPKAYVDWTPIGNDANCFEGNLHGDGYSISGLNKSLFGKLCGSVYNLGVTGTFTSAGIADKGDGYVENSWTMTTAAPDNSVKAVFGNPTATDRIQVNNCYYHTPDGTDYSAGPALRKSLQAFYNGEVAYNLNGFFLKERYNRQAAASDKIDTYNYVEDRYGNPDFLYAQGTIPAKTDIRRHVDESDNAYYEPIYPDDYLFFGQRLGFGHTNYVHQEVPSHLDKDADNCNIITVNAYSNRVYRAPAYYGSKTMRMIHFNPQAIFATTNKQGTREAYPNLTAVDFTGYGDTKYTKTLDANTGVFFAPVLDNFMSLYDVQSVDETRNLLVYAPSSLPAETQTVLTTYFADEAIEETSPNDATGNYRSVDVLSAAGIRGHLVHQTDNGYEALTDHYLVDKQEFNAPIAYTFDSDYRMWYQRQPERYALHDNTGWDVVSLPFTAELVTTQQKGELTHFYQGSITGHEYWLRQLNSLKKKDATTLEGAFNVPLVGTGSKEYTNTFLWDYYYKYSDSQDANKDTYQKYYGNAHTYSNYPYAAAATPYLIGFPGADYYEFDLSGSFVPANTFAAIDKLDAQTVTFASQSGATIKCSDDELANGKVTLTADGKSYTFMPNFKNAQLEAGKGYVMNDDGGYFKAVTAATQATAFRPYFTSTASGNAAPRRITFNSVASSLNAGDDPDDGVNGMYIHANDRKVIVTSNLKRTADVRIFNVSGLCVANFTVEPGQTVETPFYVDGVYVVHAANGRYRTKLVVK